MKTRLQSLGLCFFVFTAFFSGTFRDVRAASLDELAFRISSLGSTEREAALARGAKEEGQILYYGTLPVNQFAVLKEAFSARYPSLSLQQFYSPRQGILNRALTEARAGRQVADVIMVDLSYGSQLLEENLVQPLPFPETKKFFDGTFDRRGYWHTMYYLTVALVYNANQIKAELVPRSYTDLLNPRWKGKLLFDPEAGYILAALEQAWGREKAVEYLTKLSRQDVSFRRGGTLTVQLVAAGEYPIAIAVNGETAAEMRDKGAPLGFSVLAPRIIKPNALFVARKAPHPHGALLFTTWVLSDEGQKVLATGLGKGVGMKGIQAKYREFQGTPDFVVSLELGKKLKDHIRDFQKIFGIS
ncbi:MAG: extracellular solute-binding protein [Deltaproteobacteria bacterium]|nr:extracellular solute-binding protein [Deltaproteobacteria bacterium]